MRGGREGWEESGWESGDGEGNGILQGGEGKGRRGRLKEEGKKIVSPRLSHLDSKCYNRHCN